MIGSVSKVLREWPSIDPRHAAAVWIAMRSDCFGRLFFRPQELAKGVSVSAETAKLLVRKLEMDGFLRIIQDEEILFVKHNFPTMKEP